MKYRRTREVYIDRADAVKSKKKYDRSPNMKARIKKIGSGKSSIKVGNKRYYGTKNKNGKITLNTYVLEVADVPMKRR